MSKYHQGYDGPILQPVADGKQWFVTNQVRWATLRALNEIKELTEKYASIHALEACNADLRREFSELKEKFDLVKNFLAKEVFQPANLLQK